MLRLEVIVEIAAIVHEGENIGNPTEFTILQLASQVIEMTGSRSKIVHRPKPQDDPRQRRPDISKAQEVLKWSPRTALKDGLKTTIAYFDELLKDQDVRAMVVGVAPASGAFAKS